MNFYPFIWHQQANIQWKGGGMNLALPVALCDPWDPAPAFPKATPKAKAKATFTDTES